MAWKILSALAAVCLAGASFFAWKNNQLFKAEKDRLAYTEANKKRIVDHKAEAEKSKADHTKNVADTTKELETTKAAVVDAAAKAQEKEQELAQIKTQFEAVSKTVAELQQKIDEAGDIKKLIATIKDFETKKKEAESALTNQMQRLASAQESVKNLEAAVKAAEEKEARGRRGIVDPDFTASVSQAYPDWGFVVLNKGNGGGVFANANLEVKRGKEVIAKLKVRNVEQSAAVADVVIGSLAEGARIRTGDLVVASAEQAVKPAAAPAAAGGAAAPAANPAAPAAPAASDPFGAPAGGMAPAAPAASDPFGAAPAGGMAPAPAAPAPAASDPFGAAPAAPAPGAAPAAGGTPAAPSTADPFGAAPPAK